VEGEGEGRGGVGWVVFVASATKVVVKTTVVGDVVKVD
tara:strand:+ start:50 stop:163 length:114 start_codon:yes stop_codon:yes gene_type:complete